MSDAPATTSTNARHTSAKRRNFMRNSLGYLFVAPSVLIISLFGLFPIFYSIYMSTFNWRVTKGNFIGLKNYTKLIGDFKGLLIFFAGLALLFLAFWIWNNAFKSSSTGKIVAKVVAAFVLIGFGVVLSTGWDMMVAAGDEDFLTSLTVTLFYALLTVPTQLIIGLTLAYILFQNIKGKEIFRMLYFLPYITPAVSTAVVFRIIFSPRETSLANIVLSNLNIVPQEWLYEPNSLLNLFFGTNLEGFLAGPSLALITIAIYGVWTFVGYDTVIYLAGLGSISTEVYEAAEIDGSNGWHLFWHITFPLISPVSFYLLLISFIGTFKAFNHIFVMSVPSAQQSVVTASVNIFKTFYNANNYGYAASQAVILFLIIVGLTIAQNKLLGRKVFYG